MVKNSIDNIFASPVDNINEQELLYKITECNHKCLISNPDVLNVIAKEYALSKDEFEKFMIGFSDASILNMVSKNSNEFKMMKKLNLLIHEKDYFREYITFPVIDKDSIIQDIIGYNINLRGNRKEKIRYLKSKPFIRIDEYSILAIIKALTRIRLNGSEYLNKTKQDLNYLPPDINNINPEDDLIFQYGTRTYRIRGLSPVNLTKLKVNIRIIQDDIKFTDTLDLYVSRSRIGLVNKLCELFNTDYETAEQEINNLIEQLDEIRLNKNKKDNNKQTVPVIKPEEKQNIITLLKKTDLIEMIKHDLTKTGIAGEEKNKIMLYMVYTSRKLKKPMSVVIKGDSAGGKSYLASTVLKLFPDEEIKNFTEVSAKSLFYMKEDELEHKILVIFERHGSRSSDYSIRSLQSEDRLQLAVTVRDVKTGEFKTLEKVVKGPIAYVETSTHLSIHPENETRMFDIYIDESADQTRKIYEVQNLEYLPKDKVPDKEKAEIINKHKLIQRVLEPVKVTIPFIKQIEFPVNRLRLRRDRIRFLALIESLAFLYQYQRENTEINREKYIIAQWEDYKHAYEIAEEIMAETLSILHQKSRELLTLLFNADKNTFSISEMAEITGWNSMRVRRYLKQLLEEEYIELISGGQGRKGTYKLCSRKLDFEVKLKGLLTPEQLKNRLLHFNKQGVKVK